jgi:hypothetical protein
MVGVADKRLLLRHVDNEALGVIFGVFCLTEVSFEVILAGTN